MSKCSFLDLIRYETPFSPFVIDILTPMETKLSIIVPGLGVLISAGRSSVAVSALTE